MAEGVKSGHYSPVARRPQAANRLRQIVV